MLIGNPDSSGPGRSEKEISFNLEGTAAKAKCLASLSRKLH